MTAGEIAVTVEKVLIVIGAGILIYRMWRWALAGENDEA